MQKTTTSKRLKLFFSKMLPFLILLAMLVGKVAAQPYNNGNLSTGPTSSGGVAAPAGYNWSEIQPGILNFGYGANIGAGLTLADDFTVPAGVGWSITKFTFYGYSTGATPNVTPFNDLRFQIFNTDPSVGSPVPVYGNLTTNKFTGSTNVFLYRVAVPPGTTRQIWTVEATIPATTFGPGHYWIEWENGTIVAGASNFTPGKTVVGTVTQAGNNAKTHTIGGAWSTVGAAEGGNEQDLPFRLDYSIVAAPACIPITGSVISAVSQTINEGFDGTIPPAGWTVQNNSSPLGAITWNQGSANGVFAAHTGAGYASVNFNSGGGVATISNWMIGPGVTLNNGDKFTFWTSAAPGGGIFPDRLQVRMSTNGNSTNVGTLATDVGDFTTLLVDVNPTYSTTGYPEVWTQYTATISGVPSTGVPGRIAFRYFVENGGPAGANSNYIGVDDAQYTSSATPTVCSGGTGNIRVNITGGVGPYTVVYTNGTTNTTVFGYISGNNIAVSPTTNPTTYTLVSVTGADGCVGTNNTGSATFNTILGSTAAVLSQVQIAGPPVNLFNQGFDAAIPPAGWSVNNLSSPIGVVTWNQGSANGVFPSHAGAGYASVNFNSGSGVSTLSNWMFAPSVLMKNGDQFTFWTRAATGGGVFPDRLQVRLNTNNTGTNVGATATSVGDFTTLLLDINPTYSTTGYPEAWTQYTVTMSGLPTAGIGGVIAFRYFVENGGPAGANSNYIGIDDAIYTTSSTVNPTTCVGSIANLKVDITGGNSPYQVIINATPATAGYPRTIPGYISGTSIPVTPIVTTTYNLVSVTSASGCAGTGNSGTPTVVVSASTIGALTITDVPSGPLCAGSPKLLTVSGAAGTSTFTNAAPIAINDDAAATPYPANLVVAGLPVAGVAVQSVKITGFNHTWSGDVDILLQSPTGTNVILMGSLGNDGLVAATNVTLTFSDAAATAVPTTSPMVTGTYKCTNYNASPFTMFPPGPANVVTPVSPATPTLASFTGNMNGTWKLYVQDKVGGDFGNITGGYAINFSVPSAPPVGYTWLWTPAAGLSSTTSNPTSASPMLTTTYTVLGTAPGGCQTTATILITVNQLPAVTAPPSPVTACAGSTATFSVTGSGAGLTYQWQVSTTGVAGAYANITDGALYQGTTTPTLTITAPTTAMNGYAYRCVVSGTCPPSANSIGAVLTVVAGPTITLTPTGTVCGGVAGISGTLLSTGAVVIPPVPGSVSVLSGTINLAVPDNTANGVNSTLTVAGVPANATITNVTVTLNMSHTYPGDMIFNLKSPAGGIINLYKYGTGLFTGAVSGVSTWGWYGAKVSQLGNTAWSTVAVAPFIYSNVPAWKADIINANVAGPTVQNPAGFVSTATNWNAMYTTGPSTNGGWTLAMCDGGAGDVGTLSSWVITIDYTVPGAGAATTYTWSPATGLYTDPLATIPYIAGTQAGSVYAAPTVFTTYTVTGTSTTTGCSNSASVNVNATPPPPTVTPNPVSMCLGDPAVRLISASSVPGTCSVNSGAINVAIPDANPTNTQNFAAISTQNVSCVPANATITGISVTLSVPAHTYVADLSFNLKSPGGTVINLFRNLGATGGGNTTYPNTGIVNLTLSSASTTSLATANVPSVGTLTGTFKADILNAASVPFYTLSDPPGFPSTATSWAPMFANTAGAANGTWTLALTDDGAGDIGSLTNWSIKFDYFVGVQTTQAMWSPASFLWLDQGLSQPYVLGTQHDTVYTRPTPAGVYTYNVTVNGAPTPPVTVTTPMAGGNGNFMVLFNVKNNNSTPYTLTTVGTNAFTTGTVPSVTLWYKTSAIAGNPGNINVANGWNIAPGGTAGTTNVTANFLNQVLTNVSLPLPAGATYGLALEFGNNAAIITPAYTNGTGTVQTYSANGLDIQTDGTIGWGGPNSPGPPVNNPRNFNGAIGFVSNVSACTSPARVVTVTVNTPVTITTQPASNVSVCTNKSVSFTGAGAGSGISYQWQESTDNGTTFHNITNGGVYSGANTGTLTITNPPVSMNGNIYHLLVSGTAPCPAVATNNVRLTVNALPTVTVNAEPYNVLLPNIQTSVIGKSSPLAASYSWLRNGVVVASGFGPLITDYKVYVDAIGTYTLSVVDVNGCSNTSSPFVVGDSTSNRVFVSPSPTTGVFLVRYSPAHNNQHPPSGLNVYDALGARVFTQTYSLGLPFAPMKVDMSNYSIGNYYIEVVDVDGNRLAIGRVAIIR